MQFLRPTVVFFAVLLSGHSSASVNWLSFIISPQSPQLRHISGYHQWPLLWCSNQFANPIHPTCAIVSTPPPPAKALGSDLLEVFVLVGSFCALVLYICIGSSQ
eukprot:GHVS01019488.1.p2 GENE.GHVS01019488.1~~GHVS01019488.1.p2  ORF type:complete len:104 (+),score=8.60 GHVS01019488.1:205-516(+)